MSAKKIKTLLIIPTYNEANNILKVLDEVLSLNIDHLSLEDLISKERGAEPMGHGAWSLGQNHIDRILFPIIPNPHHRVTSLHAAVPSPLA